MQRNKVEDIGRGVIEYEIVALKNLKKYINSNFNKIIKTILNCKN